MLRIHRIRQGLVGSVSEKTVAQCNQYVVVLTMALDPSWTALKCRYKYKFRLLQIDTLVQIQTESNQLVKLIDVAT